ncbi:MAG: hypothetical protein Q3M24_11785 [Candidatus Electrothrix aestuarii]|uniref:SmpA / OmlA family protein n=1 Tax=Candidatus Electrothrix aestuarii TaxID=3062594 RepID=A0AAU8M1K1_9BACT|nr:hypothetical protein [Candidatus Electrothrix aestuarii]
MVKNIIWIVIVAVIGVPSWQIGSIMLEKKKTGYMLQEQANSIKKYRRPDLVKKQVKENLELMGLPSKFSFEELGRKKVKIGYTYYGDATIFGYTYYDTTVDMKIVTGEGTWDNEL